MTNTDAKQAAMGCIDPKGNIVLREFDGVAVLFRPQNSYEPYVVANGYDKQTGEWGHGSYYSDLGHAWEKANPEIVEDACIRWQRDDIKAALESEGYPATEANVSWMENSRIMEVFSELLTEEGNERLGYLVQDEKRYLDSSRDSLAKAVIDRFEDEPYNMASDKDILSALDNGEIFFSPREGRIFDGIKDLDGQLSSIKVTVCSLEDFTEMTKALKMGHIDTATVGNVMQTDAMYLKNNQVFKNGSDEFDKIVSALAKGVESIPELSRNDRATTAIEMAKEACQMRVEKPYVRSNSLDAKAAEARSAYDALSADSRHDNESLSLNR